MEIKESNHCPLQQTKQFVKVVIQKKIENNSR